MPWCPKCKNEYIEGITACADCGVELVEELPAETDPSAPVILCHVNDKETADKFVSYLCYGGLKTVAAIPADNEKAGFDLVVAEFERESAENMFAQFHSIDEITDMDPNELMPDVEKQLEELQSEEASHMFSELRTEASSVYVKKKDKYSDLKFSGISFLLFGIVGIGVVAANQLKFISFFNEFSILIMAVVFVLFIGIGIASLIRAGKLKNIVSEEEKVTKDVMNWIDANINDELIDTLIDASLSEEDNYFSAHEKLCNMLIEQFPLFSRAYADELMDERYNDYCERH